METRPISKSDFFVDSNLDLREYTLAVEPDLQVYSKVLAEREVFKNEYGEIPANSVSRYIKVADFLGNEAMEETLIRWVGRVCRLQQCFTLSLNNYSGFPQHSIYIRIQEIEALFALFQRLQVIDNLISSSGGSTLQLPNKPHVVIAGHLSPEVYNKAIIEYARKTFYESFAVNQLLLIKRDHAYGTSKLVNVFGFLPH